MIKISATLNVSAETFYAPHASAADFLGLYIGGIGHNTALMWFDGATHDERAAAIDRLIEALESIKMSGAAAQERVA